MNLYITYGIIFLILLALELSYFRIADRFNIIDKPNERSSHSKIVLRGGGIIFTLSTILWVVYQLCLAPPVDGMTGVDYVLSYLPFLCGLLLISGVSFIDDIFSLPDWLRLVFQFVAMGLLLYNVLWGGVGSYAFWQTCIIVLLALIVCVGATNVINFMDGINGITGVYALSVFIPLYIMNNKVMDINGHYFVHPCLLIFVVIGVVVFCLFNFRNYGKAKCFAGDVGSIGIAFIILFILGKFICETGDVTWFIFLLVYGIDGVLTICHRIMLHENLWEAHRKHVYQLMANELKFSHVFVSLFYSGLQVIISLGFIYLCPNNTLAHWLYLICAIVILSVAYILFKKKYYHLHEKYLASLNH